MSFPDHFSAVARDYASYRPQYDPSLIRRLGSLAPGRGCAWDVATGSGQVGRLLGAVFDEVIATDASADQLRYAVPHPRVEYRVEPGEAPSLESDSVDLITVAAGMHWLDEPAFYTAVQRVARPGAVLAMFSYGTELAEAPALQAVLEHYHRVVLEPYWPPQYAMIQSRYALLDPPFEVLPWPGSVAFCTADFDGLRGLLRTWSGAAIMHQRTGQDPTRDIAEALQEAWLETGPLEEARRLCWPVFGRVGRVR